MTGTPWGEQLVLLLLPSVSVGFFLRQGYDVLALAGLRCMAFRHRDPRRGRLIETAEVFQVEGEASKERKQAKGYAPQPKRLCPCAKCLPWWSHRQNTPVPFAQVLIDG